jgi:hypothetical protein
VQGETVIVLARPLRFEAGALRLGDPERRIVRAGDGGLAFVPRIGSGDLVSLHWDFVCDVLTRSAARSLERATLRALRAANASLIDRAA